MINRTTRRTITALALCTLAVAPACGDDGDGGKASAAGLEGDPIKVGVIYDEANASVPHPEVPIGARVGVEKVNQAGGVDGRPLELVECDAEGSPSAAADCARGFVRDGVVATVGMYTTGDPQVFPILEEAGVPAVGNTTFQGVGLSSPMAYPVVAANYTALGANARALSDDGAESITVVHGDFQGGRAFAETVEIPLASGPELDISYVAVAAGNVDMAPQVRSVLDGEPDAVIVTLPRDDMVNFLQTFTSFDDETPIAIQGGDVHLVAERLGSDADGIRIAMPFNDTAESPDAEVGGAFAEAMDEAGSAGGVFASSAYAAVLIVAEAARQVDEVTAEALVAELDTTTGIDIGSFMPVIDFSSPIDGVEASTRVFNACYNHRAIEDGVVVPASDEFVDAFTGDPC